MFPHSLLPAGLAAVVVAMLATSPTLAGDSLSDGTRATLRAEFMRQQSVLRAQSQLGYQQLYTDDDHANLTYATPSRYATIDDQITRLAAMIAASKAATDGAPAQP